MRLQYFHLKGQFKNINNFKLDFNGKDGIALLIGNNGSGKSNILEALSSIFAGLYDKKYNPKFAYDLNYIVRSKAVKIQFDGGDRYTVEVDGKPDKINNETLPGQVVCVYSGEESRLWDEYYWPFYESYTKGLKKAELPISKMVYINKYYWNVALLTLALYNSEENKDVAEFCRHILGIKYIESIDFEFNNLVYKKWKDNAVKKLVNEPNPDGASQVTLTLAELKARVKSVELGSGNGEREFFRYIAAAFLPKKNKLITSVKILINDGLDASSLSEGEKKMLLIKTVLETVTDENSLVLMDEPDSHVHISRKASFKEMLETYTNRQSVLTTHSPTLATVFGDERIFMLSKNAHNEVETVPKEKQRIIHELTGGAWSYQEQNVLLNSQNDILLLEGKFDEIYLKKALAVLKKTVHAFKELDFEYLPCGGAAGVTLMSKKFKPKPGQKIIALLDNDGPGKKTVKTILGRENEKFEEIGFSSYQKFGDVWVALYPIKSGYPNGNFIVEDYFDSSLIVQSFIRNYKGLSTSINVGTIKKELSEDVADFPDEAFLQFKLVFDMILDIRANE